MLRTLFFLLLLTCLISTSAHAAFDQQLSRTNFRASVCNIESMDIEFKLDAAFGEPLITSKMRWQAGPNTSRDCLGSLTHVWIKVRTELDQLRYVKIRPEILPSTSDFGSTVTESPSWSILFCNQPSDSATCETDGAARRLFDSDLRLESFDVVTEALSISAIGGSSQSSARRTREGSTPSFSLDDRLADVIDGAVEPGDQAQPEIVEEEAPPALSAEEVAAQLAQQEKLRAEIAVNTVVQLISSSLAEYQSPAHDCESSRSVANWVQARGLCELNFRSESQHEFLCADDGNPRAMRSTKSARINPGNDIVAINDIRLSPNGWASLVLELSDEIQTTVEGDYKTSRWHVTGAVDQLEDLKQLGSSLLTLKDYCATQSS